MNSDGNEIFYFDANSLFAINRYYSRALMPELWEIIRELLNKKRILIHERVFDEVMRGKNDEDIAGLLKEFKQNEVDINFEQIEITKQIIAEFPKLIDKNSEVEQADPWLIASVLDRMNDTQLFANDSSYVIVTQESKTKQNRIPAVCEHFRVRCINLEEFYQLAGIFFSASLKNR